MDEHGSIVDEPGLISSAQVAGEDPDERVPVEAGDAGGESMPRFIRPISESSLGVIW